MKTLGASALKLIQSVVDKLFDNLRGQVLGGKFAPKKRLYFTYKPALTLTDIYNQASAEEGVKPNEDALHSLLDISTSYLDATQAKTKAKVAQKIQSFLQDAENQGVKTNVETVLRGQLYDVMGETTRDLKRIYETESTVVRNHSLADGIVRNAAAVGIDDPTIFWIIVRDGKCCLECLRLHTLPGGIIPKVWKMSEVGSGYHKKGENNPKTCGLHPHDRCLFSTLLPGYGFNSGGFVTYISPQHDEYSHQRGLTPENK